MDLIIMKSITMTFYQDRYNNFFLTYGKNMSVLGFTYESMAKLQDYQRLDFDCWIADLLWPTRSMFGFGDYE